MKRRKRILSCFLMLTMVLGLFSSLGVVRAEKTDTETEESAVDIQVLYGEGAVEQIGVNAFAVTPADGYRVWRVVAHSRYLDTLQSIEDGDGTYSVEAGTEILRVYFVTEEEYGEMLSAMDGKVENLQYLWDNPLWFFKYFGTTLNTEQWEEVYGEFNALQREKNPDYNSGHVSLISLDELEENGIVTAEDSAEDSVEQTEAVKADDVTVVQAEEVTESDLPEDQMEYATEEKSLLEKISEWVTDVVDMATGTITAKAASYSIPTEYTPSVGDVITGSAYASSGNQGNSGYYCFDVTLTGGWLAGYSAAMNCIEPGEWYPIGGGTYKAVVTIVDPENKKFACDLWYYPEDVQEQTCALQGTFEYDGQTYGQCQLVKTSAICDVTDGNLLYSLAGAQYGVYEDDGCTSLVATLTTDSTGVSNVVTLETGTYYVKEISAPPGYGLSSEVQTVTINEDETATVNVEDVPQADPINICLHKVDKETGENYALGGASLAGAQFTYKYYTNYEASGEPERVWVFETDEDGFINFQKPESYLVAELSDDLYYNDSGNVTIPLGSVTVQETATPEGYLINDSVYTFQIVPEDNLGVVVDENGNKASLLDIEVCPTVEEQVKRGDVEFIKIAEVTNYRLSNVPFTITSKTTGESHTIVTDSNGYACTSASWNLHTYNTNKGETSEDGIWFDGTLEDSTTVNNSLGALPYDTYILDEVACDSNKGYTLISGLEFTVSRDIVTVDLGTITDYEEPTPSIGTSLTGADGEKVLTPSTETELIDTVSYQDLTVGNTYTLCGELYVVENGTVTSCLASSEVEFSPATESGTIEVSFVFDSSDLAGKSLVCFEYLYDEDGGLTTTHEDPDDEGQTVTFRSITIHTTAKTDGGEKVVTAGDVVTIVDTVTLTGLVVGETYTLAGLEMLQSENAVLLIDGEEVTGTTTFTATEEDMDVDVVFTVDTTGLEGETLVCYEYLYNEDGDEEASHEDITDEGQSITVEDDSPTPVKTGDAVRFWLWTLLALAVCVAGGVFLYRKVTGKELATCENKEEN